MKDGAVLANAGHFDVEIDLDGLRELARGRVAEVLPLVEQFTLATAGASTCSRAAAW